MSGFASTPYNIAVGGTDFYYSDYASGAASTATYWNTSPSQLPAVSLLKTVPEQPWNNSQYGLDAFNQLASDGTTTIAAAGGGASNCATGPSVTSTGSWTSCTAGYPKPSWQSVSIGGTQYVPADGVRDLPDVSLFAANGSNYSFIPICAVDGDCQQPTGTNQVQISGVGGTSASAPSFAGIMALVNQKYGMQGQADTILYPLKAQYPAAFHDVTSGTNSVPCAFSPASHTCIAVSGAPTITDPNLGTATEGQIGTGTTPEYNATAGYNLATGLGTIDANQLITNWANVKLAGTTTTMTPSSTSFAHGTAITISGTVTGTGTPSPSGSVALLTDSTEPLQQSQSVFALSNGAFSNTSVNYLPGGTYHVWASYGGDGSNALSSSAKTQITVTPETPGMNFNIFAPSATNGYYLAGSGSGPGTAVDYGSQLMLSSEVAPTSQLSALQTCTINGTGCSTLTFTTPTGTVTFSDSSAAINTAVVNAEGDAEYNAPFAVGAHSVTAAYNGDQSYNKVSSSSPITFTVVKDNPQVLFAASNTNSAGNIVSGQPTAFTFIVENNAQYSICSPSSTTGACTGAFAPVPVLPPTGTVTLTSSPSGFSGTATLSAGVDPSTGAEAGIGVISLPSALAANTYTVTVSYTGDNNYNGYCSTCTNKVLTGTIGVVGQTSGRTASTTAATMTGSISPNSSITVTGTVTGSGSTAPTSSATLGTGVMVFTSGSYLGLIQFSSSSGDVSKFSLVLNSQDLVQGTNLITLQYTGDSVYQSSNVSLSTIASPLADFSLIPSTTIVPIGIGGGANSGTVTINTASVNGFSGTVTLTCSAASPLTCTITPNPSLTSGGSGSSTLTINVPSGTANGNFNASVTGKDSTGEFIHTLGITTVVTSAAAAPAFNIAATTPSAGINRGSSATSTVTVAGSGGYAGSVTLTCAMTAGPSNTAGDAPTCSVTAGSPITLSGTTTSGTATATVSTVAATSGDLVYPRLGNGKGWLGAGTGALLALLVFFGIPARRRSWRSNT